MRRSDNRPVSTSLTKTDRFILVFFGVAAILMCVLASVGGYRRIMQYNAPPSPPVDIAAPAPEAAQASEDDLLEWIDSIFVSLINLGILIGGGLGFGILYIWWELTPDAEKTVVRFLPYTFRSLRNWFREASGATPRPVSSAREYKHEVAPGVWEGETAPPMLQFSTTYRLGDDRYDPSMNLEVRGKFLGECGVGFAKGTRKEQSRLASAFEVWLFDKNDLQTHTHILASATASRDPVAREKFPPNAAVTLAQEGAEIVVQAKTLRLRARVVEVAYLAHDRRSDYYFERLALEIAVWRVA